MDLKLGIRRWEAFTGSFEVEAGGSSGRILISDDGACYLLKNVGHSSHYRRCAAINPHNPVRKQSNNVLFQKFQDRLCKVNPRK